MLGRFTLQYQFIKHREMEINIRVLENIFTLRKLADLKKIVQFRVKQNSMNQKDLKNTSKKDIVDLAKRLNERNSIYSEREEDFSQRWMWREYKLFVWVIIYYAEAIFTDSNAISHQQFQMLRELFPRKQQAFLHYEYTLAFCYESDARTQWSTPQIEALQELMHMHKQRSGEKQWKNISYELYKRSNGNYFRSAESCRNRWENHSNPHINKGSWTEEQNLELIDSIQRYGTKWSAISKIIQNGRTEHMVKNRYRSLIKRYKINQKKHSNFQICEQILKIWGKQLTNKSACQEFLEATTEDEKNLIKIECNEEDSSFQKAIIPQYVSALKQSCPSSQENNIQIKVQECQLTLDEIISELNLREFGENHKYMKSLNDPWVTNLFELDLPIEKEEIADIQWF